MRWITRQKYERLRVEIDSYFLDNWIVCEERGHGEIQKAVRTLRSKKAPGVDKVPAGIQRIISLVLLVWGKKSMFITKRRSRLCIGNRYLFPTRKSKWLELILAKYDIHRPWWTHDPHGHPLATADWEVISWEGVSLCCLLECGG